MKRIRTAVLTSLCFIGIALAQKVTYQYDREIDFSRFHRYKWATVESAPQIDQITAENIVSLVNAELSKRGLVLAAEWRRADFYVSYQASVTQQRQLHWFGSGLPAYGSMGTETVSTIDNGTLVVDFYNPAQKELLWRGIATKAVDPSGNPNKDYENLQKAIEKLLKGFPPATKRWRSDSGPCRRTGTCAPPRWGHTKGELL
jgi:hypothetical protein